MPQKIKLFDTEQEAMNYIVSKRILHASVREYSTGSEFKFCIKFSNGLVYGTWESDDERRSV